MIHIFAFVKGDWHFVCSLQGECYEKVKDIIDFYEFEAIGW